jgi:hypothetical protein
MADSFTGVPIRAPALPSVLLESRLAATVSRTDGEAGA